MMLLFSLLLEEIGVRSLKNCWLRFKLVVISSLLFCNHRFKNEFDSQTFKLLLAAATSTESDPSIKLFIIRINALLIIRVVAYHDDNLNYF